MKRLLYQFVLVLVSCFIISSAYAQHDTYYLGLKGGISIPNLSAGSGNQNPLSDGFSSRLGADFGVLAEFPITKTFSIQPEIDYSGQGGKHDGLQAVPNQDPNIPVPYLYANYKNVARVNYLQIPILAKFNFRLSDKWKFYVDAGPYAGFLLGAKEITSGSSYLYLTDSSGAQPVSPQPESFDSTQSIKSQINTFNFGIVGLIGFSYKVGGGRLFIEGGGSYGFINIQKYASDGTNYSGAAVAHIGYEYALHCKKK